MRKIGRIGGYLRSATKEQIVQIQSYKEKFNEFYKRIL